MADVENIKETKDFYPEIPMESRPFFLRGSNALGWGMQNRFSRIFNPESGRTVMLAIDHGYFMGPTALGGMLAGAMVTGVLMALFMANAGGAWVNAKKYIEAGAFGGKGSEPHMAAVIGDTVGDPFKDTSGPSLNILIKLMTVVSLVLAPWFAAHHGIDVDAQSTSWLIDTIQGIFG